MSRRSALAVVLAVVGPASAARAQRPTISPAVDQQVQTTGRVTAWLFAQPFTPLADVVQATQAAGGSVRHSSRWLHAVSADLTPAALAELRTSPLLRHLQPVAVFIGSPATPIEVTPRPPYAAGLSAQDSAYGPSAMPFRRLNLFPLVDRGYRGTGMRIAVLDTGFETGLAAFASAKVIAEYDFVYNDSIVRQQANDVPNQSRHGTATWSLLAANVPGTLIGVAPDAEYILAKTEKEGSETRVEEDNYVAALEWADSLGANVVSSSLSYLRFDNGFSYTFDQLNGNIAVTTVAADSAVQRGIAVITAMGNGGPNLRTLETPADGHGVVAVGAEDSVGVLATFSSRGPTSDGRVKPDLTAPGVSIWVLLEVGGYARFSGTSFSTPLVAGAATLLKELHPTLGPGGLRDALRRTGTTAASPNPGSGWGRPDVYAAATFPFGVALTTPGDTVLDSPTPTFAWNAPGVPAFGSPVSYHLRVMRVDTAGVTLVDTMLGGTQITVPRAQRPGARFAISLTATGADSATLTVPTASAYVAPPWASLIVLDDPGGTTISDPRPVFRWSAAPVFSPPGPFSFDIEIFRTDNQEVVARAIGLDTTSFKPSSDLELNTPFRWRVRAHLGNDTALTESRGAFLVADGSVPPVTLLFQNFPNPFPNDAIGLSTTCIWFDLATSGKVRLEILDLRGHPVRVLVPGGHLTETLPAGRYGRPGAAAAGSCDPDLSWDGRSSSGALLPRGIYLAKLATPAGTFFKRIVFLGRD